MAPVAQGDTLAAGFTLPADLGVSPRHCANWVVVCVPTGGTIFSLEKWPCSVSVGGNVPALLGDDVAVGGVESRSFQRKEVWLFFLWVGQAMTAVLLAPEDMQDGEEDVL